MSDAPDRFEQAWAKICEHFPQAVLIVEGDHTLRWRSTNATWALGACERYRNNQLHSDNVDYERGVREEGG